MAPAVSLSAGLATNRARLGDWFDALLLTKNWLTGALTTADRLDVGHGPGPLDHFHHLWAPTEG